MRSNAIMRRGGVFFGKVFACWALWMLFRSATSDGPDIVESILCFVIFVGAVTAHELRVNGYVDRQSESKNG